RMTRGVSFLSTGAGGWSPLSSDRYQWLEVDLGGRTRITAVATQGRYGSSDWQTSYLLIFSDTGHNWRQYRQEGSIEAFLGNSNADSVVQHKLQHPVIARYVRLIPLDWNPNGRIGLRLETYGCPYNSDVVSFSGLSSLLYRLTPRPTQTSGESISLKFKALKNSGILLHAEGQNQHRLTLELEDGKLLLLLRKGTTLSPDNQHLVSLSSLLDDQHWHHVAVEHHNNHLNLTVDKSTVWIQIPARFSHWDHDQGNVTFSCGEPVFVAMTFAGPQSFLWLPGGTDPSSVGLSVGLQFRTWNKAGLLLTFDLPKQSGAVWWYLSKARLHLQIHKPGRAPLELSTGSGLNDGQWHSVDLVSGRGHLTITVDGDESTAAHVSPSFPIIAGGQLFFGGCPSESSGQECMNPFKAFQGCMRLLTVDNQPVDLIKVQQRLMGNYSHLQIDMCDIIDRCSPSHCEHEGSCSQSWTTFHCNCSGSGYTGATCHSSIYEQSCEAYKLNGNTSGFYHIDVDGSGPVRPQLVYCDMTEHQTWTVIQHNNSDLTRVRASPGGNQYSAHFEYASDEDQLAAIIGQSEHCEQELTYHCRKSRILNSAEGSPVSWWVGGPGGGHVQTYWGGASAGSQRCGCSLQQNCVDPKHHCNCDADRNEWSSDSGLLTHKETLPVRSLVLGDVQRSGSESAYKVGSLRCYGDSKSNSRAFFDKETSYLHFPTFHGELSADISFLFKTTSSSGVFLENLGIKDFIRIELSSSTEVLFSFDVGNGPLGVSVKADFPLNDDRWHRVQAERNVKEASLRIDELPVATQEAPADGHIHLQLNSQLFIGGTASRQKGFRGCIRSLQLNGVTLDLEERANITPGVRAGCPGHCSTYGSLCQNQGQCVDGTRSFSCDCSGSPHSGAFCHRGTLMLYIRSLLLMVLLSFCVGATQDYTKVLFCLTADKLEVRYRLDSSREAEILRSKVKNLNNRQLHTVTINRLKLLDFSEPGGAQKYKDFNPFYEAFLSLFFADSDDLDPELSRLASLGFTGCLSSVLFNSISPLKAALLHPNSSSVSITGSLVQYSCGSTSTNQNAAETTHHLSVGTGQPLVNAIRSDSALIGGGIAVVIFVTLSALAVMARFLYRRKGSSQSQEGKTVKPEDSPELPFSSQTSSQNGPTENQKEYFI
uniref:Contactin associated protein like 3 n=1 Tax=Amphiprion percula TaxID=161767 RepID=A0A3P8SL78_AMPPE